MPATPDRHLARSLALLYSPPAERGVLEALFRIEREIVASLQGGLDHHVAHVRLQWWQEECQRACAGRPSHPLTQAIAAAFAGRDNAPLAGLTGFVDTTLWDLATATFESRRELAAYCERWAGAVLQLAAAHALPAQASPSTWLSMGAAIHEIEMLANLAAAARAGRLRLPLDELQAAAVPPDALANTPWPPSLVALLRPRHEALRHQILAAMGAVAGAEQPAVRGLLVWAALACRRSLRVQRALPYSYQPTRSDTLAESWLAWRTARHALSGKIAPPVQPPTAAEP